MGQELIPLRRRSLAWRIGYRLGGLKIPSDQTIARYIPACLQTPSAALMLAALVRSTLIALGHH